MRPISRALVRAGADHILDIGFHRDLQQRLSHGSQEITFATLLQQLDKRHAFIGLRRWFDAEPWHSVRAIAAVAGSVPAVCARMGSSAHCIVA